MSEYTTFLKVGATSILLRMLEDPSVVLRDMTLENPIRAIREISHDMTCRRTVRLANGREVQRPRHPARVPRAGHALRARPRASAPLETKALEMWEHCVTTIEKDPLELDREVDWVIKHNLIEAYRERTRPAARPPEGRADGPAVPRREPGPRPLLQDAGPRPRRAHVHRRRHRRSPSTTPPQTTRARLRGEFIRKAKERKRDYTVDWVHLKLNDQAQRTVLCKDPFKSPRRAGREAHRLALTGAQLRTQVGGSTSSAERAGPAAGRARRRQRGLRPHRR